ncbi:MAG TPA: DinB family protein [candidate division Zixibacteria bacterium]|nr:DinB family protein [candidate division Zixibacteria bacterium]
MAAESFKQYQARLLGYLGKQDPIKVQQATPGKLERLIKGVSRNKLIRRPVLGKWSVQEILVHLCDDEIAIGWRIRIMITRPGVSITSFDQDDWVRDFKYEKQNTADALALFRSLRKSNLTMLRLVSKEKFKAAHGIHEERGKETLDFFVRLTAGHDLNHLGQIKKLLK